MKHTELRKKYLEFFKSKGHTLVASDSLIPAGDPTLLFTGAGMIQFKNEFMGKVKAYTRATSCQKCIRTGDLENVGRTAYHHTFFEMLGNFSFGDYFKEEAISWAWEFMLNVLEISEEKLWVSVYEEDEETYAIWKEKIKIPTNRIVKLGQKDNFWPSEAKDKGPNGPCGPCSEIFYDYGTDTGCKKSGCDPSCDCGRFVEVWNLVFTHFERKEGGVLDPLPNKNIDTGMGLERLCAVMQGKASNFETDIFAGILKAIRSEMPGSAEEKDKSNIYAIADHVRAVTFAIADGVTPSNEERGYVIRNLIRKAVMRGKNIGIEKAFLYRIVYAVAKAMEEPYPELMKQQQDIAGVVKAEEELFAPLSQEDAPILQAEIEKAKSEGRDKLSGESVFKLRDTYGFPLEVIANASGPNLPPDYKAYEKLMQAQRNKSRKSSNMEKSVFADSGIKEKTKFIGYDLDESDAKVVSILLSDGNKVDVADKKFGKVEIILDKSPLYGESGGQVGDTGILMAEDFEGKVINSVKISDAILLEVEILKGEIKKGDVINAKIDMDRRLAIAKNHTATHLLQEALRETLGRHVKQQGSHVGPDRLRFDFTHNKAVTYDELERVEQLVNEKIKQATNVKVKEMSIEDAKKSGALAFFGEKYEQTVRVVSAGEGSKEFCGGTHLNNTSEIELFVIMKEGSVASGIRRIEATTALNAKKYQAQKLEEDKKKQEALNKKELLKQEAKTRLKSLEKDIDAILDSANKVSEVNVVIRALEGIDIAGLKRVSDLVKNRLKDKFIVFLIEGNNKVAGNVLLGISQDLIDKGLSAGKFLTEIVEDFGGSGGGRPNLAQGGFKSKVNTIDLLKKAKEIITKEIG